MIRELVIALVAISVFTAEFAFADEAQTPNKHMHELKADANGDGIITHDEFKAQNEKMAEEHFKRMDTNDDGKIDQAEMKAFHVRMMQNHKEWRKKHLNTEVENAPAKALESK